MFTATRSRAKAGKNGRRRQFVQKARGVLHPRVQRVRPEHFGVVCVDCAKARSKWMLCDFYGNVLIEPTVVTHARGDFDAAIVQLRDALERHRIKDQVIVIERTGNYHLPVKRVLAAAGFETRIVHPFATKQFRQAADPGNKTDDTDLAAIFRAAISGFGLEEPCLDETHQQLRMLTRHRRDLVEKRSILCCQIREHLEAAMPGYAACFDDLWESPIALPMVRHFPSAKALSAAGVAEVCRVLQTGGQHFRRSSVEKVIAWSMTACAADPAASVHHRLWQALDEDRAKKCLEIQLLEREIAYLLAHTPYILLLSFPGINVVSAGEFGGEMGPIDHYPHAKAITGRAGLFPSRYQSDQVDAANGSLIRCANRSLRAIIMMIADNLIQCNGHFRSLAAVWRAQGKDPRHSHVKIACRFSRIAFQIVAGRQVFHHPGCQGRDYILQKLLTFLREHDAPLPYVLSVVQAAVNQIPNREYSQEAAPLQQQLEKTLHAKRGPKPIGEILTVVLARLGVSDLQSSSSEVQDPS
jgi:transposase